MRPRSKGSRCPYGDVAVGGWRNTPYVVIQNVGAYLDIPRFLDSDHRIENAADAEAYLARLQSYAKQLDGERGRMQAARAAGLVPPAFLIDKALEQMRLSAKSAREGAMLVESIERRTKNIPGAWAERARTIAAREVAPALERQLGELQARASRRHERCRNVGAAARRRILPLGAQGVDDHHHVARRDPRVGPKRAAAPACADGRDPAGDGLFAGDGRRTDEGAGEGRLATSSPKATQGRAEIMAFIQNRLDWIRSQMPRAFNKVVNPNMEVKRLPPEEEPGAPGAYGGAGSIDGTIPGRFWINLRTHEPPQQVQPRRSGVS